jgi:hypothetical protein
MFVSRRSLASCVHRRCRRQSVQREFLSGDTLLSQIGQLRLGLSIAKRQVMRLLNERQLEFRAESRDMLRAGLESATWISVDDTGARHAGRNGFCTQVGNGDFTWFGKRPSKSRLNFLDVPRANHTDYVINEGALDYMLGRALAGPVMSLLASASRTRFADGTAWQAHLKGLGISDLQVAPEPADRFAGHRFASRPDPGGYRDRRRAVGFGDGARLAERHRHRE